MAERKIERRILEVMKQFDGRRVDLQLAADFGWELRKFGVDGALQMLSCAIMASCPGNGFWEDLRKELEAKQP